MECKFLGLTAFLLAVLMQSCEVRREPSSLADNGEEDPSPCDTAWTDTLDMEEELVDDVEDERHLDENFMDFLFSFARSHRLQRERICYPLAQIQDTGDTLMVKAGEWQPDFSFLEQDYYTVLYDDVDQIEELKNSNTDHVLVEAINLTTLGLATFDFERNNGRWNLVGQRNLYVQQSDLSDFLVFYRQFCTDSLFQCGSIVQPLHFSMLDPEDEMTVVEGTIDVEQWSSFCPEVPSGIITNVRSGQTYTNPNRMVLQKCGQGNGLMEVFVFEKNRHKNKWMLISYEN